MSRKDTWYIAIGDEVRPRKYFNRETQGFTDIAPNVKCRYTYKGANRLRNSGEPYKIWAAMCENAPDLVLWSLSESSYRDMASV